MIKRIFVIAIALFIFYSVFVRFIAPVWWSASQHQWQANTINAEKFVFSDTNYYENVLVGSSLTTKLIRDSFPSTYSLSFGGLSIYDGLSILTHKTRLPKNIFVEMNVALHEESKDFTDALNSPIHYYSKSAFVSLRADKQPIGILGTLVNSSFTERMVMKFKYRFHLTPINSEVVNGGNSSDGLFAKMLEMQVDKYSKLPDTKFVNECFSNLKSYVNELEKKGVNFVFYEMPVAEELNNLPRAKLVRQTFYMNFPASKYEYIPIPDSGKFETSDGLHLNKDGALKYTIYLKSKLTMPRQKKQ
ncbi:MAG: hypothetical protein JWR61_5320 [Ferruginibacter sp.]|uniref:hypothetical protein n=1 Tax=Ferruginibacter sp. TaxID=1940288 RepID=UPI00265A89C9|nr:hypothetical protein [Ferruginibacter sp.]MDB5280365.1 hypothetical protein [Ferruginibacter sp.]